MLVIPPEIDTIRPVSQDLSRYISRSHALPLLLIPSLVVEDHVCTQRQREYDTSRPERGCRGESRNVIWSILLTEDI